MRRILHARIVAAIVLRASPARPLAQNTITLEGSVKSEGVASPDAQVTVVNVATHETSRATTRRDRRIPRPRHCFRASTP